MDRRYVLDISVGKMGRWFALWWCVTDMHTLIPHLIPHLTVSATGLMATSLVMSGLAMLICVFAASIYVVTIKAEGRSLLISTGCTLIGFCLSKLWMVS